MTIEKTYDPNRIESRWYEFWESNNYFAPANPDAPSYCIMIPPPNVTGSLHMGHAFQDLIMDALTRYHRMHGRNTLWQPGTDHAGIATQMVVERALAAQGKTRHDYGREKFIEKVWQWKAESGGTIARQLKRMGASADWQHERFTMDDGLSDAVNRVFVQLYDEGIIYRGKRLVNWDPVLLTAVSDLEVVSEEESGTMYYVRYPFVDDELRGDDNDGIVIGTTRPETILVDGAIAVHPADDRFASLVGKRVWVPMTEPARAIEIIADDSVQADFGSGCVKITAAHDFNDFAVYARHPDKNIPLIVLFTPDAKLNDNAPEKYRGMDRYDARDAIVADLRAQKLLVRSEPHRYKLPRGDRSGAVVEPMMTDQWYVDLTREVQADGRVGGKAMIVEPAVAAVRDGAVKFVPANWSKTYHQWLANIEDWCISRQIWWGHRIPAWYDDDGNVYVAKDEAAVREKYNLPATLNLRRDEDVLDTWFSSALWPFSTLGWPQKTARLKTFYPTSVLVTGFDIIFFWVARMIMMGEKFMGEAPFDEVYIHGLVRDAHGNKMSKSKGNVLDPIDLIDGIDLEALVAKRTQGLMRPQDAEKIAMQTRADFPDGIPRFGADALRFTFAALASTGRDINFDLSRTEGYRNFCNKLWNAARFVLMQTQDKDCGFDGDKKMQLSLADEWMLSTLQRSAKTIADAMKIYRFDLVAKELHELIWRRYCDWYVELCKPVLNDPKSPPEKLRGTRNTLATAMEIILRMAHPIIPFISEEIWQSIAPVAGIKLNRNPTIMTQPYPQADAKKINANAEAEMQRVMDIVLGIRQLRGENNIAPGKRIKIILTPTTKTPATLSADATLYIQTLAKTEPLTETKTTNGAMTVAGEMQIILPLDNLIDTEAEIKRANKELESLKKQRTLSEQKLTNKNFIKKAPKEVVKKEKNRLAEMKDKQEKLETQLEKMTTRQGQNVNDDTSEMSIRKLMDKCSEGIDILGFKGHTKASELYVDVKITGTTGFMWRGLIPYYYRRTGLFIETADELAKYLNDIKGFFEKESINKFIKTEQKRWDTELSGRRVTKEFFDKMLNMEWNSARSDFPNNPNWTRRIQDIKEMGYTLATDMRVEKNQKGVKRTHVLLLPIPKGGTSGYEVMSSSFKKRAISALNSINAFELSSANKQGLIPDHKFPEIRWDSETRTENDDLTTEQIAQKFQLLDNQRNLQKREVCRKCFQSGNRGTIFGVTYFYEGSDRWPTDVPQIGKGAEKGCVGCAWYDIQKWRNSLNELLSRQT